MQPSLATNSMEMLSSCINILKAGIIGVVGAVGGVEPRLCEFWANILPSDYAPSTSFLQLPVDRPEAKAQASLGLVVSATPALTALPHPSQ